ncbi:NADH-ubiquinone oxidoreductase-F iron-sulfur binding region domain-containing protein [Methanorbis furvi]|uniref:NADP-reducing hydrogenase subunit HndC n=1 Tax=Methanorbis furvi TaxID=3028299 RepID=A0AAE4S9I6_9EURY|nr:NADP-reducing hydrogenase subunit HndC [Methanocorpusculaceae archaeon Ag1]
MTRTILVCCGTGCRANGGMDVSLALTAAVDAAAADANVCCVTETGCSGLCELGPLVRIMPDDIMYYRVRPSDAHDIIQKTVLESEPIERLLFKDSSGNHVLHQADNPFYGHQKKIALRNVGIIDSRSIDEYIAHGGYSALARALEMTSDEIIREVEESGIRGRGGAGFPTGRKWRSAAVLESSPKYVICNGDEGDPGAFMDGSIMDGDPHSVLEGMMIGALAIGAEEGFLYIRDEYIQAVKSMKKAIRAAEKRGLLGESILGTNRKLYFSVVRGGGAFVCGESTALMSSIEGNVGEPRAKYIHSVEKGLWGCPTVINNVETWANIPVIINGGGKKFAEIGTKDSTGTKVFALVGKVKYTGLVEVPMGITLRKLIFEIGGGIPNNRKFKAVQTGGPSGGCIPASLLDIPVDFDTLKEYGTMMGSGGMIVMDDHSCMVEFARYYVNFLCGESCGKCTPCREGLRHMRSILTNICNGYGREGDIELLEMIGSTMIDCSLCALGSSAPNPVLTTIRYFREEYEAHIREHRCPAGVCKALTAFSVNHAVCKGCMACTAVCPTRAIVQLNGGFPIITKSCNGCGSCRDVCRFNAIEAVKGGRV